VVSGQLTRIHVLVHTDPNYHSVCAMSEGVNCETVAASPYSLFAGLPVSVWGILGYLVMGGFGLWATARRRPHATWPLGLLVLLACFSVAVSALLGFISVTRIDSFCLFCMASYAINLALLVLVLVARARTRTRLVQLIRDDAKSILHRPRRVAVMALAGAATVSALYAFVPAYWRTLGWSDLPKLATGQDQAGHHWIGGQNPRATIVELSDYECPYCRSAHKAMRLLAAQAPDQIRLVHRHFPLDMACNPSVPGPFHQRACLFAEAAECAGLQGRFWEMNDALFSVQEKVRTQDVDPIELAVRLGLNRSEFNHCLESHATAARIATDVKEGMARNLRGTPSFILGDQVFMGRIPEDVLKSVIGPVSLDSNKAR
jgi:protein-disulfide isomerase/uncharacterized membrane protein